ncbi:MAG TPA: DMT family transporter [Candidatus Limnocylindria bacterium]|nr:DMT family transporter [Candidatus Limnocylindria bacterium]
MIDRLAVLLVALAAMLWGTDTLFRAPLLQHLPGEPIVQATQIVTMEHIVLTIVCLPILWLAWREIRSLSWPQWRAVVLIGVGASALATILFTISFGYFHFIETLLLQKTQPLIAILLAHFWLGERISKRAWLWVPVAILGAYCIVIPDPLDPRAAWEDFHVSAGLFAIAAAALWGAGTVFGRYALANVRFTTLTALRFTTALPALVLVLLLIGGPVAFASYRTGDIPLYLAIALIPGLFPMLLYYRGLASTPASLATLAELAFPITGILVNLFFVTPPQSVSSWQLVGIVVLTGSLIALDYTNAKRPAKLERGAEVALT